MAAWRGALSHAITREPVAIREFRSSRRFQLWDYQVSHGWLLIRSNARDDGDRAIELAFRGVDFLELRPCLEGVRLWQLDPAEATAVARRAALKPDVSSTTFAIESGGRRDHVVANACYVLEDTIHYDEASRVLPAISYGDPARWQDFLAEFVSYYARVVL